MAASAELVEFLEVPIQAALEGDLATDKQERGSSSSRTDLSQASTTLTGLFFFHVNLRHASMKCKLGICL